MKDTPENRVKKSITEALKQDGWFIQYNPQFGPYVIKGRPDMEAYKGGRVLLIECKSKEGRQSPDQKRYEERVSPYAQYILARSVEDIKPFLTTVQTLF
ncbi:MAG: hypothetical protein IJR22_00050 [Acidaminococcaceae bacterium]|nr:hypothetical protein [Acidaminococcaceae bacterium]